MQKNTIVCIIMSAISLLIVYLVIQFVLNSPLLRKNSPPVRFLFLQKSSAKSLANKLHKAGILRYPKFMILVSKITNSDSYLQAGEYEITPGMTPVDLIKMVREGRAINHALTIIEGWTFDQVRQTINANKFINHSTKNMSDLEIMKMIGHAGEIPEGRFAPDTYIFSGEMNDVDILKNAYQLMQRRLDNEWANKAVNSFCHCPYEALIVASIIEKESAFEQEKPKIAGVMMRRLKISMPLQIDATVIYGLNIAKYGGGEINKESIKIHLTEKELHHRSAYNTYINYGLPPSPISMPSVGSIKAALHPANGDEIYYVAIGDGSHHFSSTLIEHNDAKKKYKQFLKIISLKEKFTSLKYVPCNNT